MGRRLVAWFPGCSQSRGRVCSALFLLPAGNAKRGRRGAADHPAGIAHRCLIGLYVCSSLAARASCRVRGKHDCGSGRAVDSCIPKSDVNRGLLSSPVLEALVCSADAWGNPAWCKRLNGCAKFLGGALEQVLRANSSA